jgi:hypothetical protein
MKTHIAPRALRRTGLLALIAWAGLALTAAAEENGTSLFNGKDLSGWQGDMTRWSVEDGAITGQTTADTLLSYNTFLIWNGGQPADFELHLQYRIVGGNSGVQYRSKLVDQEKFVVGGYQADIDSTPRYSGICYEERGRGILAERGQKVRVNADGSKEVIASLGDREALQNMIKSEQWNDYRIVARGNHLQHIINGVTMSEVVDEQKDKAAEKGIIALQLHAGPAMIVQFKDIQLKEVD